MKNAPCTETAEETAKRAKDTLEAEVEKIAKQTIEEEDCGNEMEIARSAARLALKRGSKLSINGAAGICEDYQISGQQAYAEAREAKDYGAACVAQGFAEASKRLAETFRSMEDVTESH